MAQTRIVDWRGPRSSALHNQRWYEAMGNLVLNGLGVVPGTTGMKVTIQTGAGLIAGLTFAETATQADVLELDAGHHEHPRIDTVVAQYTRTETVPQSPVIYTIVEGTAAAPPSRPSLASNQLRLADILVAKDQSTVTAGMITLPLKMRERVQSLVQEGVLTERPQPLFLEGVIWVRDTDPNDDSTITVRNGDFWVYPVAAPDTVCYWNGTEWIDLQDWDNLKNVPATFPVGEHELAGEAHTGQLPIARVSGHTAFGPPAHQEAFMMSLLRRP